MRLNWFWVQWATAGAKADEDWTMTAAEEEMLLALAVMRDNSRNMVVEP